MVDSQQAVKKLVEYLKIRTDHPKPDYVGAVKFLKAYSNEIGFDSCTEIHAHPDKPVVLMSYFGKSPEKKAILLNSHTDVVPVEEKYWTHDPFEGKIDENGNIFGRGVQDMKSVGIQHLELMRKMIENKIRPERTIHLSFVPDEELGGLNGMGEFVKRNEFKNLNIGLVLDEGQPCPTDEFNIYYDERIKWNVDLTIRGNTGHGSRFIEKTAAEKLV